MNLPGGCQRCVERRRLVCEVEEFSGELDWDIDTGMKLLNSSDIDVISTDPYLMWFTCHLHTL